MISTKVFQNGAQNPGAILVQFSTEARDAMSDKRTSETKKKPEYERL